MVMGSIIIVTPLYILVSGRKIKRYRPIYFGNLEPIVKVLCVFCFVEVIQSFLLVVLVVFGAVEQAQTASHE